MTLDTKREAKLPEETHERILLAARDAIARKGKRGATTREIADVADVNEATLFRHFGSKEALLLATAQRFCGVVELKSLVDSLSGDLESDLFIVGKTMLERMESIRDMLRWSLVEEDDGFALTTWQPQKAIHEVMVAFMKRFVDSGEISGDPGKLALVFMGFTFAHVLARKKFPDEDIYRDPNQALRLYIHVFVHGVRSK
ncbi:MAG TPA: TetR/AcrR family transcriptional regulator [Verrucomicrobiae bacterium]|nr:TetR/AcrR family transcriptional regulator [Verrucomicrobiae bacterium]